MALTTINTAPSPADFIPLDEHQTQTPGSFFAGKPVLHLHCPGSQLRLADNALQSQPAFAGLNAANAHSSSDADEQAEVEIKDVDVWVTSRYLALWSTTASKGVQISYPTITIHAQDRDAVLLELNFSDSSLTADEDLEFMQLRLVPTKAETTQQEESAANGEMAQDPAHALYQAIGACQELNPDPPSQEDGDDEAIADAVPGATGWITSDNMDDYVDEDGNFRFPSGVDEAARGDSNAVNGADSLGSGAGRTRTATEANDEDGDGEEDAKWQRTG